METRAYLKGTRLSPQKAGLVADVVRGKSVHAAIDFLTFHKQKASAVIKKLLESAIANAENNDKADIDLLFVRLNSHLFIICIFLKSNKASSLNVLTAKQAL